MSGLQRQFAESRVIKPDYGALAVTLAAMRPAPARVEARRPAVALRHPLAEIVIAGGRWQDAVTGQQGCFHPEVAGMMRSASTQMTAKFTFAL